jgi:predicted Zn-dependent protease
VALKAFKSRTCLRIALPILAVVWLIGCSNAEPQAGATAQAQTTGGPVEAESGPAPAKTEPVEAKGESQAAKVDAATKPMERSADAAMPVGVAAYGQTPTDDECNRFAKEFQLALRSGDAAAASQLVDWDAIADRAMTGIDVPPSVRTNIADWVRRSQVEATGWLGGAANRVKADGTYRLLRIRAVGDEKHALFRMTNAEGGVTYHQLVLVRKASGEVRAADLWPLASGQMLSQTCRRHYMPQIADVSPQSLAKAAQAERDCVKHADDVKQVTQSLRDGRASQGLEAYARLPDSLKRDKSILVHRMRAAATLNDEEFEKAVQTFRSCQPDDPCVNLVEMDTYMRRKADEKARAAIDRLDKLLGGDPYLDVIRATTYLSEREYKKAKECACRAVDAEKDLVEAYVIQLTIAMRQDDFGEFTRMVGVIESVFGGKMPDMTGVAEFEEYTKSPRFQEWLKRKQRGEAPSDDKCRQFAEEFERAVTAGDLNAANALVDWRAVFDRALAGLDMPAQARTDARAGFKDSATGANGLMATFIAQLKNGAKFKLLRIRTVDEQKRPLLRLTFSEPGVNYYEFVLVRGVNGKVLAADMYVFGAGELLSESTRRTAVPIVLAGLKSGDAEFRENDYMKHISEIQAMAAALREGRPREALDVYARLPDSLKKEKFALLARATAATAVGEKEYDEAVGDLRSSFPDDPCLDLISLPGHFAHKRYDEARAALDRVDEAVGGDPYLDVMRGTAYLKQKKYKNAIEHARKAAAAEKDLLPAYWLRVAIALAEKEFKVVTSVLILIERDFGVDVGDLTAKPEYAEYVKSPRYKEWLKRKR